MSAPGRPPVALTIAGSDPSGGAGVQADLKTFSALGAYGTTVLTALTAQSTRGVTGVHVVPPDFVRAQLDTLLADVRVDAVKIGMLAVAGTVDTVREALVDHGRGDAVLDPVMVSTAGSRLLADDAVAAVRRLVPHVGLITPNLPEAAVLLDRAEATDLAGMRSHARALRDLGARRVLLKGGHLAGDEAVDLWLDDDGEQVLAAPRVATRHTHGTGCTLSAAIAALLPRAGDVTGTASGGPSGRSSARSWRGAAVRAKQWLHGALAAADGLDIGQGPGPVHHFHELWRTQ